MHEVLTNLFLNPHRNQPTPHTEQPIFHPNQPIPHPDQPNSQS